MPGSNEVPPFRLPPGGVPILRKRAGAELGAPEPQQPPPGNESPDARFIAAEIRTAAVATWSQLREISLSLAAIAEPSQPAHIPCLAPVFTPDGTPAGWGVFCYACSFGSGGEHEFRYCQLEEVDLSAWPPQRVVAAPEFVEEGGI